MGMFDGKKGLVLGVANNRSIAWAIAKTIMDEGGEVGFTHLPDSPDDEKRKNRRRVTKCTDQYPEKTKFVVPLNVQDDENIAEVMKTAEAEFGKIRDLDDDGTKSHQNHSEPACSSTGVFSTYQIGPASMRCCKRNVGMGNR